MLRRVKLQVIWLVRDRQRSTCCTAQNLGHKQTVSLLQVSVLVPCVVYRLPDVIWKHRPEKNQATLHGVQEAPPTLKPGWHSVCPWLLLHITFPVSLHTPEADHADQLVTPRFQNTKANSIPWHSVQEFNAFPTLWSFVLITYFEFLLDISCSRKKNEKENLISWISCQLQFNSKVCCKTWTRIPSCSCRSLSPPPTDRC